MQCYHLNVSSVLFVFPLPGLISVTLCLDYLCVWLKTFENLIFIFLHVFTAEYERRLDPKVDTSCTMRKEIVPLSQGSHGWIPVSRWSTFPDDGLFFFLHAGLNTGHMSAVVWAGSSRKLNHLFGMGAELLLWIFLHLRPHRWWYHSQPNAQSFTTPMRGAKAWGCEVRTKTRNRIYCDPLISLLHLLSLGFHLRSAGGLHLLDLRSLWIWIILGCLNSTLSWQPDTCTCTPPTLNSGVGHRPFSLSRLPQLVGYTWVRDRHGSAASWLRHNHMDLQRHSTPLCSLSAQSAPPPSPSLPPVVPMVACVPHMPWLLPPVMLPSSAFLAMAWVSIRPLLLKDPPWHLHQCADNTFVYLFIWFSHYV